ncbi:hypothetical protein CY35_17G073600 [Sphagnum magellanicum]|nr:hypothetical protein CY35_17G073600 [Sphagnum magellanicum]
MHARVAMAMACCVLVPPRLSPVGVSLHLSHSQSLPIPSSRSIKKQLVYYCSSSRNNAAAGGHYYYCSVCSSSSSSSPSSSLSPLAADPLTASSSSSSSSAAAAVAAPSPLAANSQTAASASAAAASSSVSALSSLCSSASRRELLQLLAAGSVAVAMVASPARVAKAEQEVNGSTAAAAVDTTITDYAYLDLMVCPSLSRPDRTLGNTSQICTEGEDLGRIVIGLYGNQVPQTVSNFKAMCTGTAGSSFEGTIFHRVLQGQYIQAGRQGLKEKGEVASPAHLDRNEDSIRSNSFKLKHTRPGTVSLCLSENDDEEGLKLSGDYRNVEFLITTGPGPAPQLDNGNIVFGTILEGMDVVSAVSTVPTYKPSSRIRQFNNFAELLGDDRAANARSLWNKPLKAIVIKSCGVLDIARKFS